MPIDPSKNKLEDIESGNDFLKNLTRFTDSMLNSNATLSQKHWFKSICFPLAFVLELINSLFKILRFIKLDNKNLGNSSNLILALISTILTFIAVVCFFSGFFSVAVGICLVTSMSLGVLFNLSLLIYNFFQFNRLEITKENNKIKATYKSNCFKYGSGLLVGFITLSVFVMSVFFSPYLITGILVGAGIFSGIIVLVAGFYKLASYIQNSMTTPSKISTSSSLIEPIVPFSEYERLMDNLNLLHLNDSTENFNSFQYYKNENYCEHLTNDLSKNRAYLLTVIFKKINFLDYEIEKNKRKLGEQVWTQEQKRIEKINLLINLSIFLLPTSEKLTQNTIKMIKTKIPISTLSYEKIMVQFHHLNDLKNKNNVCWKTHEDFYDFFKDYPIEKAFQSFFKDVSDVKALYNAVIDHFEIEKLLNNLDKSHAKIQIEKEKIHITLKETDPKIIKKLEKTHFKPYVYSEKFAEEHY